MTLRRFGWGALVLVLLIASTEGALRFLGPRVTPTVVRTENEGYQYRPHLETVMRSAESGRLVRFRTNSHGARGEEWPSPTDRRPYAVAVIGNSFVAATQTEEQNRFTEVLETLIEDQGVDSVVMNFGVDGQHIVNYLDRTIAIQRRFAPDLFVIVIANDADFVHASQTTFRNGKVFTYRIRNDRFFEDSRPLSGAERRLRKTKQALRQLWLPHLMLKVHDNVRNFVAGLGQGTLVEKPVGPPCPNAAETAYRLTAGILRLAADAAGGRLVVLQIPSHHQIRNGSYVTCAGRGPEEAFAVFAQDLPLVQVKEALKQQSAATYYPFGHLTDMGHRVVASALFSHIAPRLAAPGGKE